MNLFGSNKQKETEKKPKKFIVKKKNIHTAI